MKRFILINPLAVQLVVKYILENRKTEVIFRTPERMKKISREIDLSKLIMIINNLDGEMPIEIPLVGEKEMLSSDWVEDVFV